MANELTAQQRAQLFALQTRQNFQMLAPESAETTPATLQFTKHAVPKIISPEQNQQADAWKYGYRNYGLCDTYENKAAGIYVHKKGA